MKKIILVTIALLSFGEMANAVPITQYAPTLLPISNNLYDLGTSTRAWRNLYVNGLSSSGTGTCFSADSPTLSVDCTNHKVGFGTTSPSQPLSVQGNSYIAGTSFFGGAITSTSTLSLGIGTVATAGDIRLIDGGTIMWRNSNSTQNIGMRLINTSGLLNAIDFSAGSAYPGGYLFFTSAGQGILIDASGNVGIGTTSPSKTLSISGNEYLTGTFTDNSGSAGTSGQVLTSTGSATAWSSAFTNATSTALLLAQTASVASVNTYTPTASSTYMVMVTTDVTAEAVQTLTVSVTYTDTGGTSRTQNFFGMGLTTAAIGSTGDSNFPPMVIRPLKNTAITVATTVGGVGSISYNIDASIIPISTQ